MEFMRQNPQYLYSISWLGMGFKKNTPKWRWCFGDLAPWTSSEGMKRQIHSRLSF